MKAFSNMKHRTRSDWGVRVILAAVVGALGYFAAAQSLAEALPDSQIELAHQLAPHNARITAKLSRVRMLSDPKLINRAEEERLAVAALRADPTAIPAVTTLGFVKQVRGDIAGARRLFAYSDRLSRRDLITRLWLIEDAVARDNAAEALHHYDVALRTNKAAPDILFPVLATASNDPVIAAALVKTLSARPAWAVPFLWFASGHSGDPGATARLFADLHRAKVPVSQEAQASLINALIDDRDLQGAWSYYALVRKGADRRRLRDPEFAAMLETPSRLDWVPANNDTGLSATIQPGARGGILDFSVPPSMGGEMVQQMQLLPPGEYIMDGHSLEVDQGPGALPYWLLKCAADGRELGRVIVSNSAENGGRFAGRFTVPADCTAQYLVLVARASDGMTGVTGQIDSVQLRPTS
jgi:hypothetical protein